MSVQSKKRVLYLVSGLAILLVGLALSLSNLELLPGQPFPVGGGANVPGGAANLGGGEIFLLIIRGFLALAIILLPVYILISLMTPEGRRRLLIEVIILSGVILSAMWLSQYASQQPEEQPPEQQPLQAVGQGLPAIQEATQDAPVYEPDPQNWMVTLTVIVVALVLAGFLFAISRSVLKGKRGSTQLDQLAENAQQAVKALGMGLNFENVIIQCYVEMSQTIQQSRGIQRNSAMTPLEFQSHLEKYGVPSEPVRKLTRLFEIVRYGHLPVEDQGKREAVESLNQIIAYCRSLA